MRKGITEDELSDLLDSCAHGPIDCYLLVDNEEVRHIVAEPESKAFKWGWKNKYFVVRDEVQKGEWGAVGDRRRF